MSSVRLTTCSGACLLVLLCVTGLVRAQFPYSYSEDFAADRASLTGYVNSTLWSSEGVPPSGPYLYCVEIDGNRCLAFVGNNGRNAELTYRFPPTGTPAARVVKGYFALDVSFPPEMSEFVLGRLECQTSSDGTGWSAARVLDEGWQDIPLTSASGVCYVKLTGAGATIDNIDVYLSSQPVTIQVPRDFPTIQAAIDNANNDDIIEVATGTYRGQGNRDIDFKGKTVTVRGAGEAKYTILDCEGVAGRAEGGHRGFYFHSGEGSGAVVSNLTIRGGRIYGSQVPTNPEPRVSDPIGGGIYCANSSPTIANCIIVDCGAELGGGIGGVRADPVISECTIEQCIAGELGTATSGGRGAGIGLIANSNATISKCIIRGNAAYRNSFGAGLYFQQSVATVAGCTISNNIASYSVRGGGAYCTGGSTRTTTGVTFRNCIFSRNAATAGAGICVEGTAGSPRCRVEVVNCTIAQNVLQAGAVAGAAGGIQSSAADLVVTSSILWSTGKALAITGSMLADAVTYSDIEGAYSGRGNINTNPQFASLVQNAEDYHLKSTQGRYDPKYGRWVSDSVDSPCIDAGDPSASYSEEPLPNGGRINMGAYGGTKEASRGPEHATLHVKKGGNNFNSGLTPEQAFETVQAAINESSDGDTVLVWPGTYREDLDFCGKAITVRSADDAATLAAIDGYTVMFRTGGPGSVLANFIITGASDAGILCDSASPTLKNLTIVGNRVGIIAYDGSDPNITNCIIWYNNEADVYVQSTGKAKPRYSNLQHNIADKAAGNLQAEPMFADRTRSDYHLRSQWGRWDPWNQKWVTDRDTSPCIDMGNWRDDYRGEPAPNGGRINMGAYGGTPYASKSSH